MRGCASGGNAARHDGAPSPRAPASPGARRSGSAPATVQPMRPVLSPITTFCAGRPAPAAMPIASSTPVASIIFAKARFAAPLACAIQCAA
ncbi:Uncharacterised protein [Burkholderia pseudomallei]|nr:Uncharacterised protein [Burkholderia pseudomallei]